MAKGKTVVAPMVKSAADTARDILQKERDERAKVCSEEIAKSLQRHNCAFDISVILKAGQVIPQIQIIANENAS